MVFTPVPMHTLGYVDSIGRYPVIVDKQLERPVCFYSASCKASHAFIKLCHNVSNGETRLPASTFTNSILLALPRRPKEVSSHNDTRHDNKKSISGFSCHIPRSSNFSSLLESRLSRRSCLSISALIRFDSFASSLRQQAIMDSRVIPSGFSSPVKTGPDHTRTRFQLMPSPQSSLRCQARRRWSVGLDGWVERTGGGESSCGPRCQVVPPAENCDFTRVFAVKSREIRTGRESGDSGAS